MSEPKIEINNDEPTSLGGMTVSFERYLKRKNYQASMINDLAFSKKSCIPSKNSLRNKGGATSKRSLYLWQSNRV